MWLAIFISVYLAVEVLSYLTYDKNNCANIDSTARN